MTWDYATYDTWTSAPQRRQNGPPPNWKMTLRYARQARHQQCIDAAYAGLLLDRKQRQTNQLIRQDPLKL